MKNIIGIFSALLASYLTLASAQQVIPVDPPSKGFFITQQTMTMLYEVPDPAITLVVIMGHPGRFGLKPGDRFVKNQTAHMFTSTSFRRDMKANIVILDSPIFLQGIGSRSSKDHLERIDSVIEFYEEKFKLPIWLFGHSDGSISVSEYLNRTEKNSRHVQGAILSAGRDETRITRDWMIPALVLHHQNDGCWATTFHGAVRYHGRIKSKNSKPTELAVVTGGWEDGHPCSSGFHMYAGSQGRALNLMKDFIIEHVH